LGTRYPNSNKEKFFEVLHAGFAHKRKILLGNLNEKYGGREKNEAIFQKLGLDSKIRAENLKLEDWIRLTSELSPKNMRYLIAASQRSTTNQS